MQNGKKQPNDSMKSVEIKSLGVPMSRPVPYNNKPAPPSIPKNDKAGAPSVPKNDKPRGNQVRANEPRNNGVRKDAPSGNATVTNTRTANTSSTSSVNTPTKPSSGATAQSQKPSSMRQSSGRNALRFAPKLGVIGGLATVLGAVGRDRSELPPKVISKKATAPIVKPQPKKATPIQPKPKSNSGNGSGKAKAKMMDSACNFRG
jgi:hypothetical protein